MITEEKTNPWINSNPGYVRPRLYTPFYEEAKSSLRQRTTTVSSNGIGISAISEHNLTANTLGRRTLRSIIPDTLYMIEDGGNAAEGCTSQQSNQLGLHNPNYFPRGYESLKPGDIGKLQINPIGMSVWMSINSICILFI